MSSGPAWCGVRGCGAHHRASRGVLSTGEVESVERGPESLDGAILVSRPCRALSASGALWDRTSRYSRHVAQKTLPLSPMRTAGRSHRHIGPPRDLLAFGPLPQVDPRDADVSCRVARLAVGSRPIYERVEPGGHRRPA